MYGSAQRTWGAPNRKWFHEGHIRVLGPFVCHGLFKRLWCGIVDRSKTRVICNCRAFPEGGKRQRKGHVLLWRSVHVVVELLARDCMSYL